LIVVIRHLLRERASPSIIYEIAYRLSNWSDALSETLPRTTRHASTLSIEALSHVIGSVPSQVLQLGLFNILSGFERKPTIDRRCKLFVRGTLKICHPTEWAAARFRLASASVRPWLFNNTF
jgi:hypothetical protein